MRSRLRRIANDVDSLIDVPMNLEKLSEQIEKYIKPFYENRSVAILWDVENITPSSKSLFVEGFLEHVEQFGRITIAQAFADWNKPSVKKISEILSKNRFELVHVPKARKNSSDMSLVAIGIEMAFKYPNIHSFILVTSDSDFRPLVRSLVRNGKFVHIVCDIKISSEDLLVLADSFVDYRELIPGGEEDIVEEIQKEPLPTIEIPDTNIPESESEDEEIDVNFDKLKENAYTMLAEAVDLLEKEGKEADLSTTKVRMQMLNPSFNQKHLGFKKWITFVDSAVKSGFICIIKKGSKTVLCSKTPLKIQENSEQVKLFEFVIDIIKKLDGKREPKFHRFEEIAKELYKTYNLKELKKFGFKQLKNLIQSLENRNFVETKAENMDHYVKVIS